MDAQAAPRTIEFIARALIMHSGHVLLCRSERHGYCYLPGGHVEPGEESGAACLRELVEEAGMDARIVRALLLAEVRFGAGKRAHHEINIVFHVEQRGAPSGVTSPPEVQSRESKIAFEWVQREAIAEIDMRPRVFRDWLAAPQDPLSQPGISWLSVSE